jgi:hypothetical protein
VTLISAGLLAAAGVWFGSYVIKLGGLHTLKELEKSSEVKGYGALWMVILLAFAASAWTVIKKPKKQWAIRYYTCILFLWALIFAGIAIKAPSATQKAEQTIQENCANASSPIHLIDGVYAAANAVLCKTGVCGCRADKKEWKDAAENANDTKRAAELTAVTLGMSQG